MLSAPPPAAAAAASAARIISRTVFSPMLGHARDLAHRLPAPPHRPQRRPALAELLAAARLGLLPQRRHPLIEPAINGLGAPARRKEHRQILGVGPGPPGDLLLRGERRLTRGLRAAFIVGLLAMPTR